MTRTGRSGTCLRVWSAMSIQEISWDCWTAETTWRWFWRESDPYHPYLSSNIQRLESFHFMLYHVNTKKGYIRPNAYFTGWTGTIHAQKSVWAGRYVITMVWHLQLGCNWLRLSAPLCFGYVTLFKVKMLASMYFSFFGYWVSSVG